MHFFRIIFLTFFLLHQKLFPICQTIMFNLLFFLVIFFGGEIGSIGGGGGGLVVYLLFIHSSNWVFYYIYYKRGAGECCVYEALLLSYLCIGLICSSSYQYMQMGFFAKSNKATKRLHEWESKGHEK